MNGKGKFKSDHREHETRGVAGDTRLPVCREHYERLKSRHQGPAPQPTVYKCYWWPICSAIFEIPGYLCLFQIEELQARLVSE